MSRATVTPRLHVFDREAYRLQPAPDEQEREGRRKRRAYERDCGERDGNPRSRLCAPLLCVCQVVQKNEVAACLVGSDWERANNETPLVRTDSGKARARGARNFLAGKTCRHALAAITERTFAVTE